MQEDTSVNLKMMKHRVITLLDRKELEFMDKLGKDALFSTGHKLTYNEILKGLIDFAMEIGFSGDNIDSTDILKKSMLKKIQEILGNPKSKDI